MKIKILGPACIRCERLALVVAEALKELDVAADIQFITDERGISIYEIETPALLINDKVVSSGAIPSKEVIKWWIKQELES